MSHNRSFEYMTIDELMVKKEFDQYRLQTIQSPILEPIKSHGLKGLDETIYSLEHKIIPGLKNRSIKYYTNQIAKTEDEINQRSDEHISYETKRMLSVKPNPATFNVLRSERKNLRIQRIEKMKEYGEQLYPSEKIKHVQETVKNTVYAPLEVMGKAGQFIKHNILYIAAAATFAVVAYTGNHWLRQAKIYDKIAQQYVNSHEVGASALPVKRDIPEQLIYCGINLAHTPEVEIPIGDDDNITIPEKLSNPQAGRANIQTMEYILNQCLSNETVKSFKTVSEEDKAQILSKRNSAMSSFLLADNMLLMATDNKQTYAAELGIAAIGKNTALDAVDILEAYMPASIVNKENDAHSELSFWKWASIIGATIGGIFGTSAYKNSRNRRWKESYYG